MAVRKGMFSLGVICALLVSVVAASGAEATVQAVTCSKSAATKTLGSTTCASSAPGTTWGHETFGTTNTSISAVNIGNTILKATTAGTSVTITSTSLTGTGELHNVGPGTEVTGTGTIKFEHVTANHGCKVTGTAAETVTTKLLHAHTTSASSLTFEPNSGAELFSFFISGCEAAFAFLNHEWHVSGSVIATANAAMIEFKHTTVTMQGTLFIESSIPFGIESALSIKGGNGNNLAMT
jgi:hypothetical protein